MLRYFEVTVRCVLCCSCARDALYGSDALCGVHGQDAEHCIAVYRTRVRLHYRGRTTPSVSVSTPQPHVSVKCGLEEIEQRRSRVIRWQC